MTAPNSPQQIPTAGPLFAEVAKEHAENEQKDGPTVGASDADADAAASGADVDLTGATRDSDGVPVGEDDVEADKRASGA
jgi:hypothetical protein